MTVHTCTLFFTNVNNSANTALHLLMVRFLAFYAHSTNVNYVQHACTLLVKKKNQSKKENLRVASLVYRAQDRKLKNNEKSTKQKPMNSRNPK